jgi:hypothetical protein
MRMNRIIGHDKFENMPRLRRSGALYVGGGIVCELFWPATH